MRALRFTAFIALVAGLLGASAYLWAPLLSPETPRLRLAAPSLRSLALEPLRIPPLQSGVVHRLVPLHVAGSVGVRPARLVPRHPHARPARPAGLTPVTGPTVTPSTQPATPPPPVVHETAPTPAPAPKPLPLPLPLPHLVVPQPSLHVKPPTPAKSSTPKPPAPPPRPTT